MNRRIASVLCIFLILTSTSSQAPNFPQITVLGNPAGQSSLSFMQTLASDLLHKEVAVRGETGEAALRAVYYSPPKYGHRFLTGDEAALYDELLKAISSACEDERIAIPNGVTDARALHVANTLLGDYPLFYWANLTLILAGDIRYIALTSSIPPDVIDKQRREMEDRAGKILAQVTNSSPFEKALLIHDALALVDYDRAQEGKNSDNAYGALLEGKATCNGYACGFQYLADLAGLETAYIKGRSLRGVEHAWNAVKLEDVWYFADVTWDRPLEEYDGVYHDYFLINADEMYRDRFWDETQYPALPDTEGQGFADYYDRKGYAVNFPVPDNAGEQARILADIFYRQLKAKNVFPAQAEPVFLELKVQGDRQIYLGWKDAYVKQAFNILDNMREMAANDNLSAEIIRNASVKCNFNDTMQVLTFYPKIEAREGQIK